MMGWKLKKLDTYRGLEVGSKRVQSLGVEEALIKH